MRYANPALLVLILSVGSSAQSPVTDLRFEVASVKPSTPNPAAGDCKPPTCSTAYFMMPPGRFRAVRTSVLELVAEAHAMPLNRVVGPDWAKSERFDIEATHRLPKADQSTLRSAVPGATTRMGRGDWAKLGLSQRLSPSVDRPIVDETGLNGLFELRLEWSDENPPTGDKPSLFTAMREQLGLRLDAAERPMDVVVVDAVERPTPN